MNSIVGFLVGVIQAVSVLFGLSHPVPASPVDIATDVKVDQTLTPQQVVDEYGTLPHGLPASSHNSIDASNTSQNSQTKPVSPKSYCTPENYSVKDGVEYWGANPLKDADPSTFQVLNIVPQDGRFDLCLAEDATHIFVSRDLVLPRPDHLKYLPTPGTGNCDSYRIIDGLGVFEGVWLLHGTDPRTFIDITPEDGHEQGICYGKDVSHVFSFTNFQAINGADPASFQVLNANYTKDTSHVWYRGGLYDNYGPMPQADVNTFTVLSETYAKDAAHAYHMERVIPSADPVTFVALDDNHSKDSVHVYDFFGRPYPGIDGATAVSLDGGAWLKDASHVYLADGSIIDKADPKSFVGLGDGYGKYANHIFFTDAENFGSRGIMVSGADLSSFAVKDGYAVDSVDVFAAGKVLANADVRTFARIGKSMYYKYSKHVWYGTGVGGLAIIEDADAASFVTTDDMQFGSAKDSTHSYGFDAKGRFYSTPSTSADSSGTVSVPGMSKYTDTDFGFSFWYPTNWTIDVNKNGAANLEDCTLKKSFSVHGNLYANGITVSEYYCPDRSITLRGNNGANPVGMDFKYYFDTATHTWMESDLSDPPNGSPRSTSPANVSINTMGELHIFPGQERFGTNVIIPLSAKNFLYVATNNDPGYISELLFAKTIVATDPSVGTPVSAAEQVAAIQAEKDSYTSQNDIPLPPAPKIQSLIPATVNPGDTVTVNGSNFYSDTKVEISSVAGLLLDTNIISQSQVTFVVPSSATLNQLSEGRSKQFPFTVNVSNKGGTSPWPGPTLNISGY